MLVSTNPFNGQTLETFAALTPEQAGERIEQAAKAFLAWQALSYDERAGHLRTLANELRKRKDELARLMALEMGKPVKEGGPEVEKAAWCAEHYAEHAQGYLAREVIESDASLSYVAHEPLGTLLGILPWNAPLWLAFRYLAPGLMAGNTCVLKHDSHVQGCAQAILEAVDAAGLPEGVVVNLPVDNAGAEAAIRHPQIAGVSFTGSSQAGAKVAAAAAGEIKPSVLELGGSDPCVVLQDADLEKAADIATLSRIINAGQSCIAAKRVIVEAPVYDTFVEMLKERLSALRLGDPLDETTDIGPIAREDLQRNLHRQVTETREAGANCLLGGELPEGEGYFYPVTLLSDVTPMMTAFKEETFGPVMVVIKADNPDHALELANDTQYGLGAAIWSNDQAQCQRFSRELQAGQVSVNGIVKTDPRLPSGGIKHSGLGRELGPHGIRAFVNAKQVWIR